MSQTQPMRVLHIVPSRFGNSGVVGGAERYVHELACQMSKQTPTRLICFGKNYKKKQEGQLDIRVFKNWLNIRGQANNPFNPTILSEIRWADVIHCHQHIATTTYALALAKLLRKKIFVSHLGDSAWGPERYLNLSELYDGHLHISEYSKKLMSNNKPNHHVILGGVDTERFSPTTEPKDSNLILFVGRTLPHKGINYLIEAITDPLRLKIIGRPYSDPYTQLLRKLAQGKNIEFLTDANDKTLIESYRKAAAIVLPSVYTDVYGTDTPIPELLGQTLLEGMSCGTLGVATNVASLPEVISPECGYIVPPNDPLALQRCLLNVVNQPEKMIVMGKKARERVLNYFTWDIVVEKCLKLYREK